MNLQRPFREVFLFQLCVHNLWNAVQKARNMQGT